MTDHPADDARENIDAREGRGEKPGAREKLGQRERAGAREGLGARSGMGAWEKLGVSAGLCQSCAHAKLNETNKGTAYLRCTRAAWDSRLPRYPRLPVADCPGYEHS